MPNFSIASGSSTTYIDSTPGGGIVIDFALLDNSFNVQVNGVDLFIGGPAGAPNELEFQTNGTSGQTVRFADGDSYGSNTAQIWQMANTNGGPVVRMEINPDGTVDLYGVKTQNGPLEPLELFNGLSVNSAAIEAAWDDSGDNTIVVDQVLTGPTNASGEISDVPCFTSGTLIETDRGAVPIEQLQVSDCVLTYDNDYKPIRWIGARKLSRADLEAHPRLKPILIRANALGPGFPKTNLTVSPQHRILVSSVVAKRMFGEHDVLIAAKKLLPLVGVDVIEDAAKGTTYWHILLDDHEIIWSNGTPAESLYLGPQALQAMTQDGLREIQYLLPKACDPKFNPIPARHFPKSGNLANKLVYRHQKNNKPLYVGPSL